MALGCCYALLKYLLLVYTFVFWLSGCALVACGVWMHLCQNVSNLVEEAERFNQTLAYVLIAIGLIVLLVGFLGCCGGIKQNPLLLTGYFVFLFILFLALIGIGIYAVVAKDEVKIASRQAVIAGVENYYGSHWEQKQREFIDRVQATLHCCGSVSGSNDFSNRVPQSCHPAFNATPCVEEFTRMIDAQYNLIVVAGLAMSFGILMIFGMVISLVLCCAYTDQKRLESAKDLPLPPPEPVELLPPHPETQPPAEPKPPTPENSPNPAIVLAEA